MSRALPPNPSLVHLKKEAKALLKAQKSGDEGCCPTLRHLKRFAGQSDEGILAGKVSLQEVQCALARDYGFDSWLKLRNEVFPAPDAPTQDIW